MFTELKLIKITIDFFRKPTLTDNWLCHFGSKALMYFSCTTLRIYAPHAPCLTGVSFERSLMARIIILFIIFIPMDKVKSAADITPANLTSIKIPKERTMLCKRLLCENFSLKETITSDRLNIEHRAQIKILRAVDVSAHFSKLEFEKHLCNIQRLEIGFFQTMNSKKGLKLWQKLLTDFIAETSLEPILNRDMMFESLKEQPKYKGFNQEAEIALYEECYKFIITGNSRLTCLALCAEQLLENPVVGD